MCHSAIVNESAFKVAAVEDRREMSAAHGYEIMVTLFTDNVTSSLKRPLVVEINILP